MDIVEAWQIETGDVIKIDDSIITVEMVEEDPEDNQTIWINGIDFNSEISAYIAMFWTLPVKVITDPDELA